MSHLKIVVVGAGHLGRIHARLLHERDDCQIVGIVDPDAKARQQVAKACETEPFADISNIPKATDAAVIAAPTWLHHELAMQLIEHRCHLFVEKPMTVSVDEADELVSSCQQHGLVLQAGHVERFNPAFEAARPFLQDVKFIQATRSSGYTGRSIDIGVVHDLMIHDLDLVMAIADSEVVEVQALGVAIFGPCEDMAHARLTFANGCIAILNASRTSYVAQREMEAFGPGGFCKLNFAEKTATTVAPDASLMRRQIDVQSMNADARDQLRDTLFETLLPRRELDICENNAIADEHSDFLNAIQTGDPVRVSGHDARRVLSVASRVLSSIAGHQWVGQPTGPLGPQVQVPPLRKAG